MKENNGDKFIQQNPLSSGIFYLQVFCSRSPGRLIFVYHLAAYCTCNRKSGFFFWKKIRNKASHQPPTAKNFHAGEVDACARTCNIDWKKKIPPFRLRNRLQMTSNYVCFIKLHKRRQDN